MTQSNDSGKARSVDESDSGVFSSPAVVSQKKTIVVVGHGMVGQRMCEEIRSRQALHEYRVLVFGDDPHKAYDRVHLCRVLHGEHSQALQLVPDEWYRENRVELAREQVVGIERDAKLVRTSQGRTESYDHLILAMGSKPILAKIPGIDGPHVRALRTIEDAEVIRQSAIQSRDEGRPVVIIGGGLLGLELADELVTLDVAVHVLENADYPLSRQLEKSAGALLAQLLAKQKFVFRPGVRVLSIEQRDDFTEVVLEGAPGVACGLVVPAMGVRPVDQIAREAELRCDMFGGILVNDELLTKDPAISAIGECARHRGIAYGLVAPGYAMAETVAKRLAGAPTKFSTIQAGTRLKVRNLDLTVVGESQATGLGTRSLEFRDKLSYRRLAMRRGKVIGITSVGTWKDLPRAQEAMARAEKIKPAQIRRFEQDEPMWKGSALSLHTWPDSATVCTCMGVTCGALKRAQREGCANVEALADRTGATTVCGSCTPLVASLTEELPEEPSGDSRTMQALSVLSALGALVFLLLPPIPYSDTVQVERIDVLFRTSLYKQITGFSLAGLFALSLLFSMRKRLRWFTWGDFEGWRIVHAGLGALCLVGGFLHTGFRLGHQLDFALAMTFLGSVLLGGVAGGWSLLESRLSPAHARTLRGWLIRSHIYLLWPLPVLLSFHVLKVYFF